MKILLSAYACEPNRGSEPRVGWNWALQAARYYEVWVLTRANNREVIEAELVKHPQPNLHFIYHDLPKWARWWKKSGRGIRLYAFFWELTAYLPAARTHRNVEFDIVHRLTMNSIETPGVLWLLGRPFVWGPVGGAQETPPSMRRYFGDAWRGEQLRLIRKRLLVVNPLVRLAVKNSHIMLAANVDTEKVLRKLGAVNVQRELETAVDVPRREDSSRNRVTMPIEILWVGALIRRKAPDLALDVVDAVAQLGRDCRLTIVGDGPLFASIDRRVREASWEHRVIMKGQLTQDRIHELYEQADIFLFTSLNDTSGNVVLEAMSEALPVIALKHHGAAEMVTKETGVLVDVETADLVVENMAAAICSLVDDPAMRRRLGEAGRKRVLEVYSWGRKGELLNELYAEAIEGKLNAAPSA